MTTFQDSDLRDDFQRPFPPIIQDKVFKAVFATPGCEHLLVSMLNAMLYDELEPPIDRLSLLPQEHTVPAQNGKTIRMDIAAVDQLGRLFDIEVQRYSDKLYADRLMLYVSFFVLEQTDTGHPKKLQKIIALSISDRPLPGMEKCREPVVKVRMEPDVEAFKLRAELPLIVHVNLKEVRRLGREGKAVTFDERMNWCYYLSLEGDMDTEKEYDEYIALLSNNPRLQEAHARYVATISSDHYEAFANMMEVWKEEAQLIGAKEEGKEEGLAEGKAETAKAMKADNLPIEMICRYTGLSAQQVLAL